jgi:hypothetical protein
MDSELCILALPYSNTTFRVTFIKLYLTPTAQIEGTKVKPNKELAPLLVKRKRGRPRKNPNIIVLLQEDD